MGLCVTHIADYACFLHLNMAEVLIGASVYIRVGQSLVVKMETNTISQ